MKNVILSISLTIVLAPLSYADGPVADETIRTTGHRPFAIPTFHCLGLYWSPPGGAADKEVLVRYRRQGTSEWKEALPMRYNPIPDTDEDLTDYRGSIVHLTPATTYEVQLTLAGTSTTSDLTATTWSEVFPVSEPICAEGAGLDTTTKTGHFRLAPGSPGVNAGQVIPNFSDGYTGKAPDIGAHQRGTPPIQYGVAASQT